MFRLPLRACLKSRVDADEGSWAGTGSGYTAGDSTGYRADYRPVNENTTGLLRQYLAKSADLRQFDQEQLDAIAAELKSRPRQTLGWKTAVEVFARPLQPPLETAIVYGTGYSGAVCDSGGLRLPARRGPSSSR